MRTGAPWRLPGRPRARARPRRGTAAPVRARGLWQRTTPAWAGWRPTAGEACAAGGGRAMSEGPPEYTHINIWQNPRIRGER